MRGLDAKVHLVGVSYYISFQIIVCQAPSIDYDIVNNLFRSSSTPCIFVNFIFPKECVGNFEIVEW